MSACASRRALGRAVGEQLHLVELVHTQQAPGVAAGGPRLAPVARGGRGEAERELGLLEDLAAVHGGQRDLRRRDEPQVVTFEVVGVVGELGQVSRRGHGVGEHDGGRPDLLVLGRMAVDGERGERAQQPRTRATVEGEHGAGEPRAALHVEHLEGLADLPVRDLLVLEPSGLRPPEVLPGPPAADLHVVLVARAVRRVRRRDVGQVEQARPDPLRRCVGRARRRALVLAERAGSAPATRSARASSPAFLAWPTWRDSSFTSARNASERDLGLAVLHVGGQHRVDLPRLHPAASQRRLHPVGVLPQRPDIDHPCSK